MSKIVAVVLVVGGLLFGSSMASLVAEPSRPARTRTLSVGMASLQVPLNMPGEVASGNPVSGAVLMGSRADCDITYDSFAGVYWSDRNIPGTALLPTPAYVMESEQAGGPLELGRGNKATTRTIALSAEKPCGRIVRENLHVVDLYCAGTRTHYAIVGMQDPFMTQQRVVEIAQSLQCR